MSDEDDPIVTLAQAGVDDPDAWQAITRLEQEKRERQKQLELAELEAELRQQPSALRTVLQEVDLARLAESLVTLGAQLGEPGGSAEAPRTAQQDRRERGRDADQSRAENLVTDQ